ncbi:hypothetical protein [Lebetimonas sp. JH292]|uniref:hypothetical protein n=1 Tax=Lebetimonas sp. JH292 TaxID=990068 RepID=UPI001F1CE160|nr:hypothetical protein [Lebetimonas sp. JH292]
MFFAIIKLATIATSVLPNPTSPLNNLSIILVLKSFIISSIAFFWSGVWIKGAFVINS